MPTGVPRRVAQRRDRSVELGLVIALLCQSLLAVSIGASTPDRERAGPAPSATAEVAIANTLDLMLAP